MQNDHEWTQERIMAAITNLRNMITIGDDSLDPKLMRRLKSHYSALHKSSMTITTLERELEHHKGAIKMSEGAIGTLEFMLAEKILDKDPNIKAVSMKLETQPDVPDDQG